MPGTEATQIRTGNNIRASPDELETRQKMLGKIIEEAKLRKDIVNSNYLLLHMYEYGYLNYTSRMLYDDRLALDQDNNYIRHFLPRYSRFQEEIVDSVNEMEEQCIELFYKDWTISKRIVKETKDGTFTTVITEDPNNKARLECIKTRAKVVELKQKHGEGQNIQISAVIVQKEIATKKAQLIKLTEENKKLTVLATKDQK